MGTDAGRRVLVFLIVLVLAVSAGPASASKDEKVQPAPKTSHEAPEEAASEQSQTAPQPAPVKLEPSTPGQKAAKILLDIFGPEGASALGRYGYVVLHDEDEGFSTLLHVSQRLKTAIKTSPQALELVEAFRRFETGSPVAPAGQRPRFLKLLDLPPGGLMTPELRSLAQLLGGLNRSWSSLSFPRELAAQDEKSLFETPWGAEFAARTHADSIEEPMALAKPFFDDILASIKPQDKAVEHFLGFAETRYQKELSGTLEADAKAGNASEELRAWIRRYLTDSRHLAHINRRRAAILRLAKTKKFMAAFDDLEGLALGLSFTPKLSQKLRKVLKQGAPPSFIQLTSIGLHLKDPAYLRRYELGDSATLTTGYWVDGLGEKEKAEVQETTFIDHGAGGIAAIETRRISRRSGGPYTIKRTIPLKDSRSFVFHSIISVTGAKPLKESVKVEVSGEFEAALSRMASAEQQLLDCNIAGAEDALEQLEIHLEPLAREKPQYKKLHRQVKKRRKTAAKLVEKVAKLEEAIEASREDSSPELCRYKPNRTKAAIKMVQKLPPGCDRYLPELRRQREIILRRKSDQAAFSKALSKARWRKLFCDFSSAAERLSYGLAILDADPGARCGKTEKAAKKAERDLMNVGAYDRWVDHFNGRMEEAELAVGVSGSPSSDPAKALALLNSMTARIPSLPTASCMKGERKRAHRFAETTGEGMIVSEAAALRVLPRDSLKKAVEAVITERAKVEEAAELLKARRESEQMPLNMPEVPPARAGAPGSRLECLEEGMNSNAATIDCRGKPFTVEELMRLRREHKDAAARVEAPQ